MRSTAYGPLAPAADSPELEIPSGFRCVRLSSGGQPSTVRDGFTVPNAFDGMAAFPLPNGNVRLIRNHEMVNRPEDGVAFGSPNYDPKAAGGTTSLEVSISGEGAELDVQLVDEFPSLAGTVVNCAGGPTPWGSWLSCEETTWGPEQGFDHRHGYIFEVPAAATGPVEAVPLKAMGRFVHEAVAVDPETGIVYETEDAWYTPGHETQIGAGLYRFIPNTPGELAAGGRLQMLAITDQPGYVTARGQTPGTVLPAHWVDIEDPDPPGVDDDSLVLFKEGLSKGGAVFARLEGAFYGDEGIYIVSTNGGDATSGQVFHYRPTSADAGELRVVFESPAADVLDGPDNMVVSPRGGLVMCEDSSGDQYVRGLDSEGRILDLVRAVHPGDVQPREFAGSCFSPDGSVMFFNVQGGREIGSTNTGGTYAMWGPWEAGPI
ncbi:MAG: alkaline phosphatase PhoX [Longimicrobiales bacterium]